MTDQTPNGAFPINPDDNSTGILDEIRNALAESNERKALQLYANAPNSIGASLIDVAQEAGRTFQDMLLRLFELARDYERASKLHALMKNFEQAGILAEQVYNFGFAGDCFLRVNLLDRAAENFERARRYKDAADLFLKLRNMDRAAQNMERDNRYFEAGNVYYKISKIREAIRAYQQVPPEEENYLEAMFKMGDIFSRIRNEGAALKTYIAIISRYACTNQTIEAFYRVAVSYHRIGRTDISKKLFEKVAETDPGYMDVQNRLKGIAIADQKDEDPADTMNMREFLSDIGKDLGGYAQRTMRDGFEIVHSFPLFKTLTLKDVQAFYDLCEIKEYPVDSILIPEGERQSNLYIILDGKVRVLKKNIAEDRQVEVAVLGPGQAIGELSVITSMPTTATVMTAIPSRLMRIHRDEFYRFLRMNPRRGISVYEAVIKVLTERLSDTNSRLAMSR